MIRIYHYGVKQFGTSQADKYFELFFEHFEKISKRPLSYESVDYIKVGYRRCICGADSIYFKIALDGVIEIMTIVGRQDLDKALE